MANFIVWLIGLSPAMAPLVGILAAMGTLRTINKIVFTALNDIAQLTPTKYDDDLLANFEKSKVYVAFCYLLDFFASVKLPMKNPSDPAPPAP